MADCVAKSEQTTHWFSLKANVPRHGSQRIKLTELTTKDRSSVLYFGPHDEYTAISPPPLQTPSSSAKNGFDAIFAVHKQHFFEDKTYLNDILTTAITKITLRNFSATIASDERIYGKPHFLLVK
ncbi:hypothetical protein J6590_064228 [Homalodisca vitripennis]|nr:hypothetical protein J6590_064228 [Homalodisca vitripennis]